MTVAAVYPSVLYGADYLCDSLAAILPHVTRAYVVMMARPWGGTQGVQYRGEWVPWPEVFDDTRQRIAAMGEPRVTVIEAQKDTPWDRWAFGVDQARALDPSIRDVAVLDPDCVFTAGDAAAAFDAWQSFPEIQWGHVGQIELWKYPEWQVERERAMVAFHRGDLDLLSSAARQQRGVRAPASVRLPGRVYNLGFCTSAAATRWKHLTAMAFSPVIGESVPNPDWYERAWLHWTPETRNLEPSLRCEWVIPCAVPVRDPVPSEIAAMVRRVRAGDRA